MNKRDHLSKIKQLIITIASVIFGTTLGGLTIGRGGTSLSVFQPGWWIGTIIGLSLVVWLKKDITKSRYKDERFHQKRNTLINIWCWCSTVTVTLLLAYLTFQGIVTVEITQVALGLCLFIFGIAGIEVYVRFFP
ncbi:hypothetical protein [Enterococcus sp. AD013-P3]|uniref:hypothetical protein n=1 Tax=Enterococcus sp. AD013-P3 TaxID=3411036 RepID=UPI003B9645CB